jgi:acylphosphatase
MASCYRFVVRGRVQGVFFRQSAVNEARRLGLSGWVRNCADGSVEGIAQGGDAELERLRRWLDNGPPSARVEEVSWTAVDEPAVSGFGIRS